MRPAQQVLSVIAALVTATLALLGCATVGIAREAATAKPWVLQKGREITAPRQRKPVLHIDGSRMSGSTGCNSFMATLKEGPDRKVAIQDVALTRKLCGPAEAKIEDAFVRALAETEHLKTENTRLTFLSGKQEMLLVWTRGGKPSARRRSARRSGAYRGQRTPRALLAARWCSRH